MAVFIEAQRIAPDLVLCSPAHRTRETMELLATSLGRRQVLIEDELHGASCEQLVERLRLVPDDVGSLLLIGHNPGLQELVLVMTRESELRRRLEAKFPTTALAALAVPGESWRSLAAGPAELTSFVVPRELPR
jgi:phosphohistidine phosphatase